MLYIDANIPEVVRSFDELRFQQVPFAAALALTWTASDAQKAVRGDLPQRFTIRNRWVEMGIRIEKATKAQWPRPSAEIYSRDDFMVRQELGGTKVPKGNSLAIPTKDMLRRKGGKRGIIRAKNRPRALLSAKGKRRAFIAKASDGTRGIFIRRGKKRLPVDMLYQLVPRAQVKPRFDFEPTVREQVQLRFEGHFGRALARAIASRR